MPLRRRTIHMAHATKTSESTLRGIVLVLALAALLFPGAAWADTMVTLQEGMLTLRVSGGTSTDSQLTAIGPDFALNAASGPLGFTGPHCDPCVPGSSFGIGTSIFGATTGSLTFAGVSYGVNDAPVPNAAFVSWTAGGAGILMPPISTTFTAIKPFSISIQARLPVCQNNSCVPGAFNSVTATGGGVATFTFAPDPFSPGTRWLLSSGTYLIETPEPGMWLLVPTAVGLAWLTHKKRRSR